MIIIFQLHIAPIDKLVLHPLSLISFQSGQLESARQSLRTYRQCCSTGTAEALDMVLDGEERIVKVSTGSPLSLPLQQEELMKPREDILTIVQVTPLH